MRQEIRTVLERQLRERLAIVDHVIGTTACEELLPGLELYALGLRRQLEASMRISHGGLAA
jgi:hypothetical protein